MRPYATADFTRLGVGYSKLALVESVLQKVQESAHLSIPYLSPLTMLGVIEEDVTDFSSLEML